MKKVILLVFLFLIFISGCSKEDKTVECSKNKDDSTKVTVTISRVKEKVTITTDENTETCIEDVCRYEGNTKEEDSSEDLDKLVEQYRKDGYTCE